MGCGLGCKKERHNLVSLPSWIKLFELGGIGGVGVQSADGPAKGEFDIKLLSLRDLLSKNEIIKKLSQKQTNKAKRGK